MNTISSSFDIYNHAYSKFTPDWINESNMQAVDAYLSLKNSSLWGFFIQYIEQFEMKKRLKDFSFAEFGCGLGAISLGLSSKGLDVSGFDVSDLAVAMAKEIALIKKLEINYVNLDLVNEPIKKKFDFIIDSHLFHCITSSSDRLKYLDNLYEAIKRDGIILIETMVFNKDIQFPVGYEFDENGIVYKLINGESVPIRCLRDSIEIEEELKNSGFVIDYLYYHNELSFDLFNDYENYPADLLPKTLRIAVKKS